MTPPFGIARRFVFPQGDLTGVAVDNCRGRVLVSDSMRRKITVVDLKSFKPVADWSVDGYPPGPLAMNGQGDTLCVIRPEVRKLLLLNADDGAIMARVGELRERPGGGILVRLTVLVRLAQCLAGRSRDR